jgi:hypothetical protein
VSSMNQLAVERVSRAVGPVAGPATVQAALADLGLHELGSPTDLLAFAELLIHKGGVFEAVGRGLKVSALLRGATAA